VRRQGEELDITASRVPANGIDARKESVHDLPGDTFRILGEDVAYLKLSSVTAAKVAGFVDAAARAKGMIIDIRNYPSEFVVFALGQLLVDQETEFARFTSGDLSNPGAFHWRGEPLKLVPKTPHFGGKVVILVDEVSLSQAEYTTMAFRSSPRAKVIGSMTAGADGNVSQFALPGGLRSMISGIGVFYPVKRPTQRIGIVPDIEVRPTVAGIREGRDELLEEAIRQILGREVPAAEMRKIIGR
jgi:C-terminal processing protease CtpA/Prc